MVTLMRKMKKTRCLAACVALSLAMMILPASATEEAEGILSSVDYSTATQEEIENAVIITVSYDSLGDISDQAKSFIDNGKILYITSPQESLESIAESLSIPKQGTSVYNDSAALFAYSIYKVDEGNYAFQQHYALIENPIETLKENLYSQKSASLTVKDAQTFQTSCLLDSDLAAMYTDNALKGAYESAISTIEMTNSIENSTVQTRSASVPSTGQPIVDTAMLYVYDRNSRYFGYLNGTQWIYPKGKYSVDGKSQYVFTVISDVYANPTPGFCVSQYKVRMHCNIVGHTLLEAASLPSGASAMSTITLGASFGATGPSASASFSTSWQYNPESQLINRVSPEPRVMDWYVTTVSPQAGKSYDVAPGLQVATENSVGSRGTFTTMYCDGDLFGFFAQTNQIEFGTWF